ncbi:MAG: hypothetical protein R2874_02770 [Desulfobacterales bacterium]
MTPNELLGLILKNHMILDGNLACLQLFNYYVSLLMGGRHQENDEEAARRKTCPEKNPDLRPAEACPLRRTPPAA